MFLRSFRHILIMEKIGGDLEEIHRNLSMEITKLLQWEADVAINRRTQIKKMNVLDDRINSQKLELRQLLKQEKLLNQSKAMVIGQR